MFCVSHAFAPVIRQRIFSVFGKPSGSGLEFKIRSCGFEQYLIAQHKFVMMYPPRALLV